ncbi:MAG: NUDIX hydrolase [Chloroflexi bacterium]|nr:NUDIX hydrolase [Chloroflexota bacterium]
MPEPDDGHLVETVRDSHLEYEGGYLDLTVYEVELADGRRSERAIVGHPGAVAVVALDAEDHVLMVRQFRLAAGKILLEIPAGTLSRDGTTGSKEEPALAAARELEEETGYRARTWEHVAAFWTAPGFATELMHLYFATDLEPAQPDGRLGPDPDERLQLVRLPWRDAVALAERGEIEDAKSFAGLTWLARRMETRRS